MDFSSCGKWKHVSKNIIQYVSTGEYYGRVKHKGRLFKRKLGTACLDEAKKLLPRFLLDIKHCVTPDKPEIRLLHEPSIKAIDGTWPNVVKIFGPDGIPILSGIDNDVLVMLGRAAIQDPNLPKLILQCLPNRNGIIEDWPMCPGVEYYGIPLCGEDSSAFCLRHNTIHIWIEKEIRIQNQKTYAALRARNAKQTSNLFQMIAAKQLTRDTL